MGQGPAIQPAAPAAQMQTVQVNPNTGRPFASSREQMQYLLPDANLSTEDSSTHRLWLHPQPVQGGRDYMPTPPMMPPMLRPQPTPISEDGPQVPAGASPGGNFFTDDQRRQMYQPPMPKAPPGMMIPQVMPAPIEVGPQHLQNRSLVLRLPSILRVGRFLSL